MNEQQRVLAAIALCVAIFVGWQLLFPAPKPQPKPAAPVAAAPPEATPPAAAPAPQPEAPPGAAGPAPAEVPEQVVRLDSPLLHAELNNRSVAFAKLQLKNYERNPTEEDPSPGPVDLVQSKAEGQPYQAGLRWNVRGQTAPPMAVVEQSGSSAHLASAAGPISTDLRLSMRSDVHAIDASVALTNGTGAPLEAGPEVELRLDVPEHKGGMFSGPGVQSHAKCYVDGSVVRKELSKVDEGETFTSEGETEWSALDRDYFVVAALSSGAGRRCTISADGRTLVLRYALGSETLAPGATLRRDFVVYAGPKTGAELETVSPTLPAMIDYDTFGIPLGFIARPMVSLLRVFHGWVGSWGIAILMLTLLVKTIMFPVTYKSAVSMRRMQVLKPEMDSVRDRFKDDRERQQMEMLKLYKERGINPLQGCLPMFLQMPVWFALYRSLSTTVDLYRQPFLWLPDLTVREHGIPFLALALGLVFFGQQMLTPMTADNDQARIMRWVMPIVFTGVMIALPSGLVLYSFINTVLSIVQQLAINKRVPLPSPKPAVVAKLERPGGKQKTSKNQGSDGSDKGDKSDKAAKAAK